MDPTYDCAKNVERVLVYGIAVIRLWAYRCGPVRTRPHQTKPNQLYLPDRPLSKELNTSSCEVQSRATFLSP